MHERGYLEKMQSGNLSAAEQRRLGLSWSEALWRRSRLASGGTLLAARAALDGGMAGNLAGGGHHAFPDHGEGFCILNDVAIAVSKLRAEGAIARAVIIDLDVHQGNGTAAIFETVPEVFTFSMHGERNYPLAKMRSTLDVALPDGTGDAAYLDVLRRHLPSVLERSEADIAFSLAGVDVAQGDRFGKLALTEDGIRAGIIWSSIPCVIAACRWSSCWPGDMPPRRRKRAELHAHAFREAVHYDVDSLADRESSAPPSTP